MSSATLAGAPAQARWRPALAALATGALALGLLFHAEAAAAVEIWLSSTAFGHCLLVLPVAAWLAYERRGALAALAPQPLPALAALALPIAILWFAAERLGIMEVRQFAALFLLWLLVVACLGVNVAKAMAAPLLYLVFLVPFGAFLVPTLQDFTAGFIDLGLSIFGVPHVVTATLIEIPQGNFEVAEACAGLRFLIATIAFGALYACTFYRSPWRRAAYLTACIAVPVLANGVRALGIVLVGHLQGSDSAVVVDHVLYGWVFFSIVIALLLLLGLPFRDDAPAMRPSIATHLATTRPGALLAAVVTIALAALGPVAAATLDRQAKRNAAAWDGEAQRRIAALVVPPGCTAAPVTGTSRALDCGGDAITAHVAVFGPLAGPAAIRAWREATAPFDDETNRTTTLGAWRIDTRPQPPAEKAARLQLGDAPAPAGLALRLRLALAPLRRGAEPVVLTTLSGARGVTAVVRAQN